MIVIVILLVNHIKELWVNRKVFPFISLTLTPLIVLHVFTVDVKLAEVVKILVKGLFSIITLDFFGVRGLELKRPSF